MGMQCRWGENSGRISMEELRWKNIQWRNVVTVYIFPVYSLFYKIQSTRALFPSHSILSHLLRNTIHEPIRATCRRLPIERPMR